MKVIFLKTTSPEINLATEEYLLKNTTDEIFMLWRNEKSVIVGKNQNTLAEVNFDYVTEHKIPVVRRMTGGGAVFHDLGNLNYTFIVNSRDKFSNYAFFAQPIIEALDEMGAKATLSGRNDILLDGKKFCGQAQCMYKGRVLHHGCMLFDGNVADLTGALNVNPLKIQSKGIKSVKSRVTNIKGYVYDGAMVMDFADILYKKILSNGENEEYFLSPREMTEISKLVIEKYSKWEYNFGFKQEYTVRNEKKFDFGIVETQILLESNTVKEIRFFGDYFGSRDIAELEKTLVGTEFSPKAVGERIQNVKLDEYFSGISDDEFLSLIF